MKYIFHKQPLTRPSLKPHRWSSDKKAGWPASSGWRLKRARVHIRAISCFQSAKKHDRVEWCMCVCVGGWKAVYTPLHGRGEAVFPRGNKGTPTMKMSEKRKKPRWSGVEGGGHEGKGRNKANIGEQIGK